MPAALLTSHPAAYAILLGGVDITASCPSDTIRIQEIASDSIAQTTIVVEGPQGTMPWIPVANANPYGMPEQNAELFILDVTNNRNLFGGCVTNVRREHMSGPGIRITLTALSFDMYLDRRAILGWTPKQVSDKQIVQALINPQLGPIGITAGAFVIETNTNVPKTALSEGSARGQLQQLADASAGDGTARRFYLDFNKQTHWFKGNEGNPAPYRIGQGVDYIQTVLADSPVTQATLREATGATAFPTTGATTWTCNGSYTRNTTFLLPNEPMLASTTLDGSTAYLSGGSTLHNGDGPWSVEFWFKRGRSGTTETIWSAGTNDVEIGFDSSDHLIVYKEGTGNQFVTNATVTDTNAHHVVVTRSGGAVTHLYLDGSDKAGTTTARTFASAAGSINVGRRQSSTDRYFKGALAHVAYYNVALTAAQALLHYQIGWTIIADDLSWETDLNGAGTQVYIKGGTAAGTGFVYAKGYGSLVNPQSFILDRPDSVTAATKAAIGAAFFARDAAPVAGGSATVTGFDGWRAGQTVQLYDPQILLSNLASSSTVTSAEIKQIDTVVNRGSGQVTYVLSLGTLPWSAKHTIQKKARH
jgi:Concanavalin A-like lectin/glucanases superfamily